MDTPVIPIDQLKKNWLEKVKKNKLDLCLQDIEAILADSQDQEETLILLSCRLNDHKNKEINGLVSWKELGIEKQNITKSLIDFIRGIEAEDLSVRKWMQMQTHEKILVVTYDEHSKKKMEAFFDGFYFPQVVYDTSGEVLSPQSLKDYDLVLFDYMYHTSRSYYDLLEQYLSKTKMPVLYFGTETLTVLKEQKYADRIHSANFVSSLYTRLKEMIEFQKYYKK